MKTSFYTWCINNNHTNLLQEWDKANPVTPTDISYGTNKIYSWICAKGHKWQTSVNNRTNGHTNCPVCNSKKIVAGFNDLQTFYPDIAKEWDYQRNLLKPNAIAVQSNQKVYWICPNNHSYLQTPYKRTQLHCNCPYCSNQKLLVGFNDLQTKFPSLSADWDYDKNTILPSQVFPGTRQKVWWKCEKNHSYYASIASRALLKTGCPYCAHQIPILGENDLQTLFPSLASEWDYEKNISSPSEYLPHSNKKVYWICNKKHSYKATICDRVAHKSCPICAGKQVVSGINDLFTTNPELKESWDYKRNSVDPKTVIRGSNKHVWWKCKRGHSWQASISSRTRKLGTNCPYCAKELQTSLQENVINFYVSKVFKTQTNVKFPFLNKREVDIYLPKFSIAIEYDGAHWHTQYQADLNKDLLCQKHNIQLIRLREPNCPIYESPSIKIPTQSPSNSQTYLQSAIIKLLKILQQLTDVPISIDVNIARDYVNILQTREINNKEHSCADLPIAKEWNYEKNGQLLPSAFEPNSNKRVWWKCEHGHEWQAIIQSRTRTKNPCGCPFCSEKKVISGVNDLATKNPQLTKEWNYTKNNILPSTIAANSNKKIWWICIHGHEWQASIASRNAGRGCPICANLKVLPGYNDLVTTHPNLTKEWNYEKNGNLLPNMVTHGTDKKVWWKCANGHEWQAFIYARTGKTPSGCPTCYRLKHSHNH